MRDHRTGKYITFSVNHYNRHHPPDEAEAILADWFDPAEIAALRASGTLG